MSSVKIFSVDVGAVRRGMDEYARKLLDTRWEVEEVIVFDLSKTIPTRRAAILMCLSCYAKRTTRRATALRDSCLTNHSVCR